jgi:hypothetical protein
LARIGDFQFSKPGHARALAVPRRTSQDAITWFEIALFLQYRASLISRASPIKPAAWHGEVIDFTPRTSLVGQQA